MVFRVGINAANQSTHSRPLAIVEAASAEQACETRPSLPGSLHATSVLVRAPGFECFANQHFTAKPLTRCKRREVEAIEREAASLVRREG